MTDLRDRLNRALACGHLPQLRHQPNGRYAIREGVILSAYDIPGPVFNTAAAFAPETSPERALAIGREFFGTEHGWGMLVDADAGDPGRRRPIEGTLRARGWSLIGETPAMLLAALPEPPGPPSGLEIRIVGDELGLRDYLAPLGDPSPAQTEELFDGEPLLPPNVDALLIRSLALAQDPDVALVVGYVGDRPVGTAALYRADGVAEIGGVAVAPSFRRRGFGAALTWAAVAEGARRGCAVAALHSTEMGYPMYLTMGFRPLAMHRRYALPRAP